MSSCPPVTRGLGRIVSVLSILVLIFLAHPALAFATQGDLTPPEVRVDVESDGRTFTIVVIGHSFTAGGMVFITVYDQGGMAAPGTLAVASYPVLEPPSYLEPGEGFSFDTGGNIREEFQRAVTDDGCLTPLWVQALDQATDTLSNLVDAHAEC